MWLKNRSLKGLKPKSIDRLTEMQEYFLIKRNFYVEKEVIADWCIEAFHKQVIEKRVMEK